MKAEVRIDFPSKGNFHSCTNNISYTITFYLLELSRRPEPGALMPRVCIDMH